MNKRIKKKFKRRLNHKHYCDFKNALIINAIKRKYPGTNMIIVSTSKSGRLIKKITACRGVIPTSTRW